MSEEKRYSQDEIGLVFDSKTGWYIQGLVADRLNAYESRVKELEEALNKSQEDVKKGFWWSAEFTDTVHDRKIQKAWEDWDNNFRG